MSWLGAAGMIGGSLLGGLFNQGAARRDLRHQKALMGIQDKYNKENMGLQHNYMKGMWDYTNVGNQMKHMTNNGLNVGLMYGGSGAGGTTTGGAPSGGMPSGGQNPSNFMGVGMQSGLQAVMTQANIDLAKSQADKNRADAERTRGADTNLINKTIESLNQGIENKKVEYALTKAQTTFQEIQNWIQEGSKQDQVDQMFYDAETALHNMVRARSWSKVDEALIDTRIQEGKTLAFNAILQGDLLVAQKTLTEQQTWKLAEDVMLKFQELNLGRDRLNRDLIKDKNEITIAVKKLLIETGVKEKDINSQNLRHSIDKMIDILAIGSNIVKPVGGGITINN